MPGIFFINGLMLAGLAALAVPIVIHLLLKRKKRRLRFSTVQFFQKQDEQSSKRRKLRHWFLLALRLLLVALLVAAFARPFRPLNADGTLNRRPEHAIIVVDRTASMNALDRNDSRWTRAREWAQKMLSELGAADRAAIIDAGAVLQGFSEPATAKARMAKLEPGWGGATLADGLRQAVRLAAAAPPKVNCSIYIVSDLQENACREIGSVMVPGNLAVRTAPDLDLYLPNLAITEFEPGSGAGSLARVVISSFSEEAAPAQLELAVDGKIVVSQALTLTSATTTNLELVLPTVTPGWHDAQATLRFKDALAADNTRFATVFRAEPLRVLAVEPRRSKRVFEEESFFLVTALDPGRNATNDLARPFDVVKIPPEELAARLPATRGGRPWDLVILPAMKQVPAGVSTLLHAFVAGGGGLLLFLGEGMNASRYEADFSGLLPAELGASEFEPAGAGWHFGHYQTNLPMFTPFNQPNSGDLKIPEFTKRYQVKARPNAIVAAQFDDGVPLVTLSALGRGRIALINSSADTTWTDWQKHKTFVPWLHGLGKYLAGSEQDYRRRDPGSFVAGDDAELEMPKETAKSLFTVRLPGNEEKRLSADGQGKLRLGELSRPGIVSVAGANGHELRRFAVNVPAKESDLASVPAKNFQQQLARADQSQTRVLASGFFDSGNPQREYWRLLLVVVLALLFAELFTANKTLA